MDTDLDLLDRWCNGDADAGNQLFQRYLDSMYRFFDNKVPGEVEELIQMTFLACVRGRDQFRRTSSFRTYLFAIARNELYTYLHTLRRRRTDLDLDQVSIEDLGTSPSRRVARSQEHQRLLYALRSLPVEQQVLLELFYWEDMSTAELAEVFSIAEPAARTRLSRARKALRERMEKTADAPLPAETSREGLDVWARKVRERTPSGEE